MKDAPRRRRWVAAAAVVFVVVVVAGVYARTSWHRVMPALLRLDPAMRSSMHATDPEDAGRDFLVQGEYAAPGEPLAAQVIARGRGRFEARLLPGGLPGAGFTGEPPLVLRGVRDGDVTRFEGAASAEIRDRVLRVDGPDDEVHRLERIERRSPTLGAPAPPEAVVLFGGPEANLFDGSVDDAGRLVEGAVTRDDFGDFRLHLEFRTPFEPELRGQKRGNSGVYVQRRYEVQVLDDFGLDPAPNGAAALYGQKAPDRNMSLPPLSWQTYDIDFTAARFDASGAKRAPARITVRHNGVLVHDDVELVGPTGAGAPETPEPGPLFLQDHGNPVRWRNVWLVPEASR